MNNIGANPDWIPVRDKQNGVGVSPRKKLTKFTVNSEIFTIVCVCSDSVL